MTNGVSSNLAKSTPGSIWIGVLLIVLGIVAIALPTFSTLVAESWIALILISAGSAKLFYAFRTRDQGGFIWKLLLSVLYAARKAVSCLEYCRAQEWSQPTSTGSSSSSSHTPGNPKALSGDSDIAVRFAVKVWCQISCDQLQQLQEML